MEPGSSCARACGCPRPRRRTFAFSGVRVPDVEAARQHAEAREEQEDGQGNLLDGPAVVGEGEGGFLIDAWRAAQAACSMQRVHTRSGNGASTPRRPRAASYTKPHLLRLSSESNVIESHVLGASHWSRSELR
jgi:hypothetical protein